MMLLQGNDAHVRFLLLSSVSFPRFESYPDDRLSLADFVREQCLLTGTHVGCGHGVCGACTLMMDGRPVRSCITLAAAADRTDVRTVEVQSFLHADALFDLA
jgi:aerobic-type carbon monoxide dehydrogenase small subunit (CoxS/CutS family)